MNIPPDSMKTGAVTLAPLGDGAILLRWGDRIDPALNRAVHAMARRLESHPFPGMRELVPAYATLAVVYDPLQLRYEDVLALLEREADQVDAMPQPEPKTVEIPVRYGGSDGPDLEAVAAHHGLTPDEVTELHVSGDYLVYMIGFAPGFPYLGGLPLQISTPRRSTPRLSVPAGSVGIAGDQTGIYPFATPGGWQIIGRTPLALFNPDADPPSLLAAGDRVRFAPVSEAEFTAFSQGDR